MNTRLRIEDIKVVDRFRKDLGDLSELAESIDTIGLLHPIVVHENGTLIAGQRRLEACRQLGREDIEANVVGLRDLVRAEHDENAIRKAFLPSEQHAIAQALMPKEKEAAQERMKAGVSEDPVATCHRVPKPQAPKTRDRVAHYVGVSGRTLDKIGKVVEAAAQDPETYGPLVEEMDRTGRVNGVFNKLKREQIAEQIKEEPAAPPTGPFRVIVADPPWAYTARPADPSHRAANPYPDMTTTEIADLDIASLAHEDAILWLWTTNAHLPDAFWVIEAWGFEYKTMLTWAKDKMGLGTWLRGKTEHCLLAVKGKPAIVLTNETTLLHAARQEHSAKPAEFYEMVEKLCPGNRLELFARVEREGWERWENNG